MMRWRLGTRPAEQPATRVLLTGAAGGIGTATMEALRRQGATVVGLDLNAAGPDIIACDIRDQSSVDKAVAEAIERLGGLDVLINNAGIGLAQSAGLRPGADAVAVLDVNTLGAWRVTAAAIDALRDSRGRVVNVASGLAHLTLPFATAYCMSKRALVAYSDALRLEHGDAITVTTVYPGYIRTGIHRASGDSGVSLEGLVPAEDVEDAARTLVRAALGSIRRDVGTTRRGAAGYAALRLMPRSAVDAMVRAQCRRAVRHGGFGAGDGIAKDFATRLVASRSRKRA